MQAEASLYYRKEEANRNILSAMETTEKDCGTFGTELKSLLEKRWILF